MSTDQTATRRDPFEVRAEGRRQEDAPLMDQVRASLRASGRDDLADPLFKRIEKLYRTEDRYDRLTVTIGTIAASFPETQGMDFPQFIEHIGGMAEEFRQTT